MLVTQEHIAAAQSTGSNALCVCVCVVKGSSLLASGADCRIQSAVKLSDSLRQSELQIRVSATDNAGNSHLKSGWMAVV